MLNLAVFDLDGTIVDSQDMIVAGMHRAAALHGQGQPMPRAVRRVVGLPLEEAVEKLFPEADRDRVQALTEAYKQTIIDMRARGEEHEPLFPGALEALDELDRWGWLLGIATGKPMRGLVNTMKPHGVLEQFVTLQTADLGPGKPNPDMLLRAMSETGVDKDRTVMIGDTTYDMEMARHAGAKAVGVAWGYHEIEELTEAGAQAVVGCFAELPSVLKEIMET